MTPSRFAVAAGAILVAMLGTPSVADVVSDWSKAVAPPPPELKEVTVEPATTALLLLDIMKGGCSARPRCVAAMPTSNAAYESRAHNMVGCYASSARTASDARRRDGPRDNPRTAMYARADGQIPRPRSNRFSSMPAQTVIAAATRSRARPSARLGSRRRQGHPPVDCSAGESVYTNNTRRSI